MTYEGLSNLSAVMRFEVIHSEIRRRICFLIYPPGQRLSEVALAEEFGVSRTPIRSVLARLEAEGLVESQQGSSTRVTKIELSALKDEYELRMSMAELTGEMGVIPATEIDFQEIAQICDDLQKMKLDPKAVEYARINLNFHNVFLRRVRNNSLRTLIDQMYFKTSRIWLSNLPSMNWTEEIDQFFNQVVMMRDLLLINDDRGIGLMQRHVINSSFIRLMKYNSA